MRNKSIDLNNHLFEALERLNDNTLVKENLEEEIKRAEMITKLSTQIISNAALTLKSEQLKAEYALENSIKYLE